MAKDGLGQTVKDYPDHPRLAVSCVVVREGAVLLVQRGREPAAGRWAFPGGSVEPGERMADAAAREVREETGLAIGPPRFVTHHEIIERDETAEGGEGGVRWHYVVATHAAEWVSGEPQAADDAVDARFVPLDRLGELDVTASSLDTLRALGHLGV